MNSVAKTAAIPMLRKITPKTVLEAQGRDITKLGDVRPVPSEILYDLFGQIVGFKQKADDKNEKGVWTQFKGRFRAVSPPDPKTGEVKMWESGATHIPILEDMILAQFITAKENDPRTQIEIALRVCIVTAKPGKPSMTGYEYDVQRLLPQTDTAQDPIVLMMQAAAKANAALLSGPETSGASTNVWASDPPAQVEKSAEKPAAQVEKSAEKPAAHHKGR